MKWHIVECFTAIALVCMAQPGHTRQLKPPVADTMKRHAQPALRMAPSQIPPIISANYYSTHLGFFCRQELKLQQAHVPVIFRVGRVEDCNRLEQKPGYR